MSEPYPHAGFTVEDDTWDLRSRTSVPLKPSQHRVSFRDISASNRSDVKAYILERMLCHKLSNSWVQSTLGTLRKLDWCVTSRKGADVVYTELTQADAIAFERFVRDLGRQNPRAEVAAAARFTDFLRERHQGHPAHFRPDPRAVPGQREEKRPLTQGLERLVPAHARQELFGAIGRCVRDEIQRQRPNIALLIKLVALVILGLSGRRISEVLMASRQCLREPTQDELEVLEKAGVWLQYRNTKTGDGHYDEVFIPKPMAGIVRELVTCILSLTASLAEASGLDYLFLTCTRGGARREGFGQPVSEDAFRLWLCGRVGRNGRVERSGFIHRYGIEYLGEFYQIRPHQLRHTKAHLAYSGGASYTDVADHLGHRRTRMGLSPMTQVYIHSQQEAERQIGEWRMRKAAEGGRSARCGDVGGGPEGLRPESDYGTSLPHDEGGEPKLRPIMALISSEQRSISPEPQIPHRRPTPNPRRRRPWRGTFQAKKSKKLDLALSPLQLATAEAMLKAIEATNIPRSIAWLARQLRVPAISLYNVRPIAMRLARHNRQCAASGVSLHTELSKLNEKGELADCHKLAAAIGLSRRTLFERRPRDCRRIAKHNQHVRTNRVISCLEEYLQQPVASGTRTSFRFLAKQVGICPNRLRRECPAIARRIVEYNRTAFSHARATERQRRAATIRSLWKEETQRGVKHSVQTLAQKAGVDPQTIWRFCPDLVAFLQGAKTGNTQPGGVGYERIECRLNAAFKKLQVGGEIGCLRQLASEAGICHKSLIRWHPHWRARLEGHNREVQARRLQAAWDRMEASGSLWSLDAFAKEGRTNFRTLMHGYPDWAARLREKRTTARGPSAADRLRHAVDAALRSSTVVTPGDVCRAARVSYTTLLRHYPRDYKQVFDHARATCRSVAKSVWAGIRTNGARLTLPDFSRRCGFKSAMILRTYFPKMAARFDRAQRKVKAHGAL